MYLSGIGVEQSIDEAARLLKQASDNLHKDAGEWLMELVNGGIVGEEYEKTAITNLAYHKIFDKPSK